jgi:hypothetical protein
MEPHLLVPVARRFVWVQGDSRVLRPVSVPLKLDDCREEQNDSAALSANLAGRSSGQTHLIVGMGLHGNDAR